MSDNNKWKRLFKEKQENPKDLYTAITFLYLHKDVGLQKGFLSPCNRKILTDNSVISARLAYNITKLDK